MEASSSSSSYFEDEIDDLVLLMMMQTLEESQRSGIFLTPEQQLVLNFVQAGKNVFFTGSGGTGKTLLLQRILLFFKEKYLEAGDVVITAPTGIAAIPIGGSTIHRATGIGIPRRKQDFGRMWKKPNRDKWRRAQVWIIDEISMVSAELLDYLEQTIRTIRSDQRPFGGLQVIFAGDFFQLQPVQERMQTDKDQFMNRGLAFEAPAWHRANLAMVILKNVFRQGDNSFIQMLNGIRTGENPAALEVIGRRCMRELPVVDGIKPTVLYSKNKDANEHNFKELNNLPDEADGHLIDKFGSNPFLQRQRVTLIANDKTVPNEPEGRDLDLYKEQFHQLKTAEFWTHCHALEKIILKVGAQVMLLRNLELEGKESDLVNGSRGVVVGWKSKEEKLKELSLENKKLSKLKNYDPDDKSPRPMSAYERLQNSCIAFVPIVKFRNERCIDCIPEIFEYPILNVGCCRRLQVPLKLAWALTIHKCQGMTLDYVIVNLKNIFAEGQVYVALSRARSMEGLQVIGNAFRQYVKVSSKVMEFYKALARQEAYLVTPLEFPELDLAEAMMYYRPAEDMAEPCTSSYSCITDVKMQSNLDTTTPFEKWSAKGFPGVVICYHCDERGHPAWRCKQKQVAARAPKQLVI